jgi:hypothetical protein
LVSCRYSNPNSRFGQAPDFLIHLRQTAMKILHVTRITVFSLFNLKLPNEISCQKALNKNAGEKTPAIDKAIYKDRSSSAIPA